MAELFTRTQNQFAAYIRDPENRPAPPEIEPRRMAIYRDLFFNNIESTLSSAFPVIRSLLSDNEWQALIRDFMVKHRCKTPLFHELAREFLDYLQHERNEADDPVFLQELAHYEWVELALATSEAVFQQSKLNEDDDCVAVQLQKSPLAWSLLYQYPVHQIGPDHQPQAPSSTPVCLLVYRNADDKVRFLEINPVSARLLELIDEGFTGYQAATEIANALQHPSADTVIEGARQLIQDWLSRGVILLKSQA